MAGLERTATFCYSFENAMGALSGAGGVYPDATQPFMSLGAMVGVARRVLPFAGLADESNVKAVSDICKGSRHQVLQVHENPNLAIRVQNPDANDNYASVGQTVSDLVSGDPDSQLVPILTGSHRLPAEISDGHTFTILPFVAGRNGRDALVRMEPVEAVHQSVTHLASALAKLHKLRPNGGYGYFDTQHAESEGKLIGTHQSYQTRLTDGLDACLGVLVDSGILDKNRAEALCKYFTDSDIAKQICSEPAVVLHGDSGPQNLIIGKVDGEDRGFLVDLEEIQAGPVALDLAIACNFIDYFLAERQDINNHELIGVFLRVYQEAGGLVPENFQEQLLFMRRRIAIGHAALHALQLRVFRGEEGVIKSVTNRLDVMRQEELLQV